MLTRREIEVFSFARSCTLSNLYLVNDLTGGYVLHMAVGNGISYPVGDHLHYSSFRVWIRTGDRHRSGQDACGRFYTLYPACAFWLGSGVAGNIQNQIDGVDHWRKE